ncbi:MAG: DUF2892 domain-containing protein [Bacteroidetes bacterium]|nr:MAG: DUF2892 domain-containing protein [Bacteroidota bacterium]
MKKNVGTVDMWIRIILGVVLFALGIIYQSWWGILGVIPLLTAFFRWCPVYIPFGIQTCKKNTESN